MTADSIQGALARSLDWLLSLRDEQGRILCPEHRVEHTGKSAGAIVTALVLARRDPDRRRELVEVALQQGRRLVANLVRAASLTRLWNVVVVLPEPLHGVERAELVHVRLRSNRSWWVAR